MRGSAPARHVAGHHDSRKQEELIENFGADRSVLRSGHTALEAEGASGRAPKGCHSHRFDCMPMTGHHHILPYFSQRSLVW
jgi:hypothetical protein